MRYIRTINAVVLGATDKLGKQVEKEILQTQSWNRWIRGNIIICTVEWYSR